MNAEREEIARRIRIANRLIRQTEADIQRIEEAEMESSEGTTLRQMMLESLKVDHAALVSNRDHLIRQELQIIGVVK